MNYLVGHAVFSQTQKRLQIKSYSTEKARAPVAEEREGEKGIGKRERYQVRQSMHPFTPPFTLHRRSNLFDKRFFPRTLGCYCVSCELLPASTADALWFVNMVCLPLIVVQNAHEICLTQECLQIVRRLLWKQTTTHSLRNNNPMFDDNLWPNSFDQPSISINVPWLTCCCC